MKKVFKWTALLLAMMMLTSCAQKPKKEVPELLEPAGVQSDTAIAYIDDLYRTAYYDASIKPYVESLCFNVSGQVMEVNGHPGMMVEEGDVLVKLNQVSLQERSEQLQQDINYLQQDGKYADEIAELDIDILEAELGQLQKNETALKEKETALKEAETALLAEEVSLRETEAALTEKAAVLKESLTAPAEPEETPSEGETTQEDNSTALTEKEIALVEKELILVQNEIAMVTADITKTTEELALVTEEITLSEKEIALKEIEIEQNQTLLRQEKEMRSLELTNKRKELSELGVSLENNQIRAPFSGRIIYGDQLTPGSWVSADDPVVFLSDDNKLTVECEYIPNKTIETSARVFAHIGAKEYELKHVVVDTDEQVKMALAGEVLKTTFEIVATEEELKELEAGQYAALCLWRNYTPDALVVPSNAVMKDSNGKYVYVDENGTRVKRSVKTGTETNSLVQIVEGLEEGDVVYVKD